MYAILDGKAEFGTTTIGAAFFYEHNSPTALFTYQLGNPENDDSYTFGVREWNTPQSGIPRDMYPTLQHIAYDYAAALLQGNCTISTAVVNPEVTAAQCLRGTFDVGHPLSLDITSNVPLNQTSPGTAPSVTSLLRTQDRRWYLNKGDSPALILRLVDATSGELADEVLRTTVKKVSDCSQLKVCLKGTDREGPGSLVGAEILAPLGLILKRQQDFAMNAKCSGS